MGIGKRPMLATTKDRSFLAILISCCISTSTVDGRSISRDFGDQADGSSLNLLDKVEIAALSHYGWGYYLSESVDIDWEKANEEYLFALQNDPYSEFLLEEILEFWSLHNSYSTEDQIIRYLEKIAMNNPDAVNLNLTVANTYMDRGQFGSGRDLLVNTYRRVKRIEPRLVKALVECYQGTGEFRKADRLLRHATHQKAFRNEYSIEQSAAIFYNRIAHSDDYRISENKRFEFQTLAYEHALRAAGTFLSLGSAGIDEETMELIAVLLTGNFTEQVILMLLKLSENDHRSINIERLLAECYETREEYGNALEIWKTLSDRMPLNPYYHTRMGRVLKLSYRYKDSLLAFTTAYQLIENPIIAFEIASLYLLLKQPNKALEFAQRGPPDELDTYLLLSQIYHDLGQSKRSLDVLTSLQYNEKAKKNPDFFSVEYYLSLATTYYALKRKEDTVRTLEKALELYPGSAEVNNFLGYYLADQNMDLRRAKKFVNRALKADPKNPAYLDSLAWVLYRQGDYREAAKKVENAIRLQKPEIDGVILDHAGDIYFSLGDWEKAIHYWNQALEKGVEKSDGIKQKIQKAMSLAHP